MRHSQIENDLSPTPPIYTNIPTLPYLIFKITLSPTLHKIAKSSFKKFFWRTLGISLGFPNPFSYIHQYEKIIL